MTPTGCRIAVLGAGPAGLAAAYRAARDGHHVTVLERATAPGGMAGSFGVSGVRVDHGSHRLHPSIDPDILATLRSLLGDDLQERVRHGRIRLEDRWVRFPLETGDMLRNLPPRFALGATRDALAAPLRRPRADTFAEVVRSRLGPTVAERFYAPYVEKLWGVPADQLAGELARRRVGAASPLDVARRVLSGRGSRARSFLYPRRGFGQLWEALATAAEAEGASIRYGTAVSGIELPDAGETDETRQGGDAGSAGARVHTETGPAVEVDRVWSTLPLPALAAMADPPAPREALEAAAGLAHRAVVLVYLVLDRERYSEYDAHYFPDPAIPLARLSEPKNYRDDPEEPPERTVLCAEIPCDEGDDRWRASAEALADSVVDGLARAGLAAPAPVDVAVRRLPRVYPIYRPGFERDLAALEAWARRRPRLLTFGRQGLFVPDNSHHALAMGWAAADALRADGSFDHVAWRAARDGFRSHVVED